VEDKGQRNSININGPNGDDQDPHKRTADLLAQLLLFGGICAVMLGLVSMVAIIARVILVLLNV
jgi:hypothetical protein